MKKVIMVAIILTVVVAVLLCGCRQANQVPGVSAVASAVASVVPSLPPTLLPTVSANTSGTTTMPIASVSPLATTTVK